VRCLLGVPKKVGDCHDDVRTRTSTAMTTAERGSATTPHEVSMLSPVCWFIRESTVTSHITLPVTAATLLLSRTPRLSIVFSGTAGPGLIGMPSRDTLEVTMFE
jgi:hypothetical protein